MSPAQALHDVLQPFNAPERLRLEHAYAFADEAHAHHLRDEGTPFIEHPLRVAHVLVTELSCIDVDVVMAAFNHDVLEDCPEISPAQLEAVIGPRALRMVLDVTKAQVPDAEKAARDRVYLASLPGLLRASRLLKLADRIDNLRSVPHAGNPAKARRYLDVSLAEFVPLADATDATASRLVTEACVAIADYLALVSDDLPAGT